MALLSATNRLKLHGADTSIPIIGFGTYMLKGSKCTKAVLNAIKAGYRHIDTAEFYSNHGAVGKAIQKSGLKREELFITSKVWDARGEKAVRKVLVETLKEMDISYLDLYLIHSPYYGDLIPTYKALLKFQDEGLIKTVGVSNFGVQHLQGLAKAGLPPPAVNQIELHPFLQQKKIVDYCNEKDIIVEAYSPLSKGHFIDDPTITKIAKEVKKSNAQVMIRWSLQRGFVVLPKSGTPNRIEENFDVFDWSLSTTQMNQLDALEEDKHCTWDPTSEPWES